MSGREWSDVAGGKSRKAKDVFGPVLEDGHKHTPNKQKRSMAVENCPDCTFQPMHLCSGVACGAIEPRRRTDDSCYSFKSRSNLSESEIGTHYLDQRSSNSGDRLKTMGREA